MMAKFLLQVTGKLWKREIGYKKKAWSDYNFTYKICQWWARNYQRDSFRESTNLFSKFNLQTFRSRIAHERIIAAKAINLQKTLNISLSVLWMSTVVISRLFSLRSHVIRSLLRFLLHIFAEIEQDSAFGGVRIDIVFRRSDFLVKVIKRSRTLVTDTVAVV